MRTRVDRQLRCMWVVAIALVSWPSLLTQAAVVSPKPEIPTPQSPAPENTQPSRPLSPQFRTVCPTDVESLTRLLIRDLPSYANRISRSASRLNSPTGMGTVIIAGNPEFEPLPLDRSNLISVNEDPKQVFITTLERHYTKDTTFELQAYHWLFLTQSVSGWRLATMFSRVGVSKSLQPPTPPQESSDGAIGQAIKVWLKDCRAGVIQPSQ